MNIFFNVTIVDNKLRIVNFHKDVNDEHVILESNNSETNIIIWKIEEYIQSYCAERKLIIDIFKKDNSYKIVLHNENYEITDFGKSLDFGSYLNGDVFSFKHSFETEANIDLQFIIIEGNNIFYGTKFFYYRKNQTNQKIINAALDFGSEASQITYLDNDALRNNIAPAVMGDLLKSLYDDDNNKIGFDFKEYIQSSKENDPSADKYLRSIFFYQSINAKKDNGGYPSNEYFKFLTKENVIASYLNDSQYKYKVLPNLKLSYIAAENYTIEFDDKDNLRSDKFIMNIKKLILSNFIEAIIRVNNDSNKELLIKFTLLYPNIYNQKSINKLYEELNDIFISKLKTNQIKGFEINLLSESDAVFLGTKNIYHKEIKSNNNYIVIDSGKGTTDYSIIKNIDNNLHETLFRTGFVGAGNLITFSFLIALIYDISVAKKKDFNTLAHKLLKDLSISKLYTISNKLNEIKVNHNSKKMQNNYDSLNIDTASLDNILDNIKNISDEGDYINGAISFIINKIENDVKDFVTQKTTIFLSGRSFKFKPFLDKINSVFHGKCQQIKFIEDYPKTIALLGAFSTNNSLTTIEGVPNVIDSKVVENNNSKTNKVSQLFSFISKGLTGENAYNIDNTNWFFMEKGISIDLSKNNKIICSNSLYDLPLNLLKLVKSNNNKEGIIRFDGTKNIIIYDNQIFELENTYSINTEEELWLNKYSAFPFVNETDFIEYVLTFEKFLKENYTNSDIEDDLDGIEIDL